MTGSDIMRKGVFILLALLLASGSGAASAQDAGTGMSIIGGADGPTSIFLSSGHSLTAFIERHLPFLAFEDMPAERLAQATEALGDVADAYALMGRATADGRYGYIVGVQTAAESPLTGTNVMQTSAPDGTPLTLITKGADAVPMAEMSGIHLHADPSCPALIHVTPAAYEISDLNALFNIMISGDFAHLDDIAQRAVTVCAPPPPYLCVSRYADGVYRCEYIALTADDVRSAMSSAAVYLPEQMGDYAIWWVNPGENPNEVMMANAPLPAPLFALAQERCGFFVGSPEDVTQIASARMTVTVNGETATQVVTDPDALKQLKDILSSAAPAPRSNGPFTAVLTLTLTDGGTVTVQKAADRCGAMLFGSMRGYQISRSDNEAFWNIFNQVHALLP